MHSFGMEVRGQVGKSVEIQCPVWDIWKIWNIESKDKYLCRDPCENILIQAPPKITAQSGRIHLNNTGQLLIVTINNLQTEDSGTYVCGLERLGWTDAFTKFTLRVTDGESWTFCLQGEANRQLITVWVTIDCCMFLVGTIPNSGATSQKPNSTVIPDVFTTQLNGTTSHMDATAITSMGMESIVIFKWNHTILS